MNIWDVESCRGKVASPRIKFIESSTGIKLPDSYVSLIKECDGGTVLKDNFNYYDIYFNKKFTSGVGRLLKLNESEGVNFLKLYNEPPEFFPKGLIAFSDVGCGDFICFDYREEENTSNPPIVYWNHEAEEGKDVSFIAKNFEEFIDMLYEDED